VADWGDGVSASCTVDSNCPLARAMDGHIMRCGTIGSCQSAATSEIVKRCWSRSSLTHVSGPIASFQTFTFYLYVNNYTDRLIVISSVDCLEGAILSSPRSYCFTVNYVLNISSQPLSTHTQRTIIHTLPVLQPRFYCSGPVLQSV